MKNGNTTRSVLKYEHLIKNVPKVQQSWQSFFTKNDFAWANTKNPRRFYAQVEFYERFSTHILSKHYSCNFRTTFKLQGQDRDEDIINLSKHVLNINNY